MPIRIENEPLPPAPAPAPKREETLILRVELAKDAPLPQGIFAALRVARALQAVVSFTWNDRGTERDVRVAPNDTYQGVQRRLTRQP